MVMNVIISQNLKVSYPDTRILKTNGNTIAAEIHVKNLNFLERGLEVTFFERLDKVVTGRGRIRKII